MRKLLFIYNPHAGKGRVRGKLAGILNAFTRAQCLVTAYPTQGPGDASRAVRELSPSFDRIAVCGGDGTLHEVIAGLMDLPRCARPPIGYIPAGTTNDFARNLHLPGGMEEIAALAATGEPRPVDIGRLEGRYFTYVAALGAFTDVSYNTPQQFKNAFGHLAYLLKGVSELATLQSYSLRVEHDGGALEGDFLYVMVSNTVSVGGVIGLPAEDVSLSDGLLEAVLVRMPQTVAQMNAAIYALARQEYTEESGVAALHSSRFRILSGQPVPFTLDGEFGGEYSQADIAVVNAPIQIVFGRD